MPVTPLQRLKSCAQKLEREIVTLWFVTRHPHAPMAVKFLALLTVAYVFSPIDLIPDFIPVLGYLDDLLVVPLAIYLILRLTPPAVLEECRSKAEQWHALQNSRPKSYGGAIVIVIVWCLALFVFMRCVRSLWRT